MTYCAKFSLGQFYVAKTRSYGRIVSGKILGNYNLSFARTRQAPPDVGGLLQKVVHLGCLKNYYFQNFSCFSLLVGGGSSDS